MDKGTDSYTNQFNNLNGFFYAFFKSKYVVNKIKLSLNYLSIIEYAIYIFIKNEPLQLIAQLIVSSLSKNIFLSI